MSDALLTKRVGLVHGDQGGESLGQALKVLDAMNVRYSIPIETQVIDAPKGVARAGFEREFAGLWLGAGVSAAPWLKEMSSPVTIAAPYRLPGQPKPGLLVWAYEEVNRIRIGKASPAETYSESTFVSKISMDTAARAALTLAKERFGFDGTPIWAFSGWGEVEEFAGQVVREATRDELRTASFEQVVREPLPGVIVALGRTALPLARILGTQCWLAWSQKGTVLAQSSGPMGAGLASALFLDRLGWVKEGSALEQAVCSEDSSPFQLDRLIDRILAG